MLFKFGGEFQEVLRDPDGCQWSWHLSTFHQNLTGNADVPNSGLGMASFLLGLSDSFGRDITLVQPQEKQWRLILLR